MRRSKMSWRFALVLVLPCVLRAAPAEHRAPFIAFATDFEGFRSWVSWTPIYGTPGNDHLSGPRRVYFSSKPSRDDDALPVGTIIVKESGIGPVEKRNVFAMVKRGGGFNAPATPDWEWFELESLDDRRVRIVWRGAGPTNGDAYGGDPTGGCASCHDAARSSDYVFTLQLYKAL